MALIKCPECGKEISNKSDKCIHCGYPFKKANMCVLNGKETDLSFLLDESYSILYKVRDVIQLSNSSIDKVKPVVDKIVQTKEIPKVLNLPIQQAEEDNKPKCPICNSTDLSKISATKKAAKIVTFGIFGMGDNGKTWKCNKCGSKF